MNRENLEHLIRAAAAINNRREVIVLGKPALLGLFPEVPEALLCDQAAEFFLRDDPVGHRLINQALGMGSPFAERFGYCARTVDATTAVLPEGWERRLVRVPIPDTEGTVGLFLEAHDLAASILRLQGDQNIAFVRGMLDNHLVDRGTLLNRVATLPGVGDDGLLGSLV